MLNRILSSKEKINTSNKRLCKVLSALILVLSLVLSLAGCSGADIAESINPSQNESTTVQTDKAGGSNSSNKNNSADKNDTLAAGTDSADWRATLPEYSDSPYVIVNNNEPFFTENDMTVDSFEYYGELDELGRCTVAYASIGKDLMPTEKRGSIGSVKPTGWHTVKYDIVDGKYLYNRCHLIGYQLTAENANKNNLITGTRYLNVDGMLLFENMVADYIKETNNHVLYRVTPIFTGDNLLADVKELASEDIVKAAAEAGISERTVQNAKRNMVGILGARRVGGQWYNFIKKIHISSLFCCFALCKDEFRVEILVKGNGCGE